MNNKLLADIDLGSFCGDGRGLGPFGNICDGLGENAKDTTAPGEAVVTVVSVVIGFITVVAALYFMIQFILGGIAWISSTGDKQKLETAQSRITQGFLGLIVVVAAYGIMTIISSVLGFNFLDPVGMIRNLVGQF